MRQPLEMILSFRLEVAAYCIVVVEHTTVMQTQKTCTGLCVYACVHVLKNAHAPCIHAPTQHNAECYTFVSSSMRKMHAHGIVLFDTRKHNTQKPRPHGRPFSNDKGTHSPIIWF